MVGGWCGSMHGMSTNRRKRQARQRAARERAARQARRERAAELFAQGRSQAEVARELDVKPIAKTERCMFLHEGYCVSGSAIVQAEDGSETRIGPGDGYVIQPGHDAWVLGDEPWVTVDFSQAMAEYAKPS
jgi:hypothetical protein